MSQILEQQRQLYNAALEERIGAYRHSRSVSLFDQIKSLTEWRRSDREAAQIPLNIHRWTLRRLADSYASFFRRVKSGQKAGFPRFRGKGWFKSFGFNEFSGVRLVGNRLKWRGMSVRLHMHRAIPDQIKSCVFTRDQHGWFVGLQVEVLTPAKVEPANMIGIDVGLTHLATLSDGTHLPNPRVARQVQAEMRRRQRALARCRRGSKRRTKVKAKLAQLHRKIKNTRDTYLHQVSAKLVKTYDLIAVEKLQIRNMMKSNLARSISDASWGKLVQFLTYKAERAGKSVRFIDPKYTSEKCSSCGILVPKSLSDRRHTCQCGCDLDRDHNAALNIEAVVRLGFAKLEVVPV